ncbi:MAG: hypothetical protein M3O91_03385 [Chloroflexota bacterium]|nr:hypothetical protein [Chloroflexota bacterium]
MTKQTTPDDAGTAADPFETWRTFYEANEKLWSSAAKETMSTEAFAQMQGKMLETFLAFQKTARDSMSAQLATFNLPSRDDVARLGELILGLEEKIDALDDRLAGLEKRSRPTAGRKAATKRSGTPRKRA